jgi:hypothetical protein
MATNQGCSDGMDMLAVKMDLLMKKLEALVYESVQAIDPRMTCNVCGNSSHLGSDFPNNRQYARYIGNGGNNNNVFRPNNYNNQEWNSRSNLSLNRPREGNNFNNFNNNFNNQSFVDGR